mmetsp:Transcript_41411/g.81857  ORF Transcript_41411/g.81857 Transcript_41411/m.81857 type:complete len:322 (-) Transcript_41411:164-1129(-)|eukprot:CAMPEP_0172776396 /NCGR_PEP_ID=MMETSP1074-20121228/199790_1 /TAXON_ID=2916 /ORGANISM="Ceratium fusus, Strain PA161109" /LENGTH=321 /DNA_ID=CAMNT_0013613169 /DNA_START=29 /DNA_END=994 /DNA_ORIENTATION=-
MACTEQDEPAIACRDVAANGLTFRCRFAGEDGQRGCVLMLHGFPLWSKTYEPLMRVLARQGYRCAAFDQRGYSPDASPDAESDYHYDKLREDLFAVAAAIGFEKFHLVGHDHGGLLSWYAAGSERGQQLVLSLTALSMPHPDAFSAGLLGEDADTHQQMISQYFSIFTMPNSATMKGGLLYYLAGKYNGFTTSEQFQKALWWYNGAMAAGVISRPPSMSASTLTSHMALVPALLRLLFGGNPDAGCSQTKPVGNITMPTLYICGSLDRYILGLKPFAQKTAEYCSGGYSSFFPPIGHGMDVNGGQWHADVLDSIAKHIQSV